MKKFCPLKASKNLLIIALFLLSACVRKEVEQISPFQFITPDASAIVLSHNPQNLIADVQKNAFFKNLKGSKWLEEIKKDLEFFRLLAGDSTFNVLSQNSLTSALVLSGAKKYGWLFLLKNPSGNFQPVKDTTVFELNSYMYEGTRILKVRDATSRQFFFSQVKNNLLFSREKALIEEAIRTYSGKHSLHYQQSFVEALKKINKKEPLNLLINVKEFASVLDVLMPADSPKWMGKMGVWASFDALISENTLQIDGLVQVPDSMGLYFSVLSQNYTAEKKLQHLPIPAHAEAFVYYNLENFSTFYRKYVEYLEQNAKLQKHQKLLDSEFKNIDIKKLQEWLKGDFGLYYLPEENGSSKVFFCRTNNAQEFFNALNIDFSKNPVFSYRGQDIFQWPSFKIFDLLFSNVSQFSSNVFYTIFGEYLLFSDSESALISSINSWEESLFLTRTKEFEKIHSRAGQIGHFIAYSRRGFLQKNLQKNIGKKYEIVKEILERSAVFNQAIVQISPINQNAYISALLTSESTDDQPIRQLWTLKNADPINGPYKAINHLDGSYEIVYQDSKNVLHVLSATGSRLWQKQLDAPVVQVSQWDMFKNGRLQHVVVTQRSVYVIDRNGNDVPPWPKKFGGTITSAALMDYDRNRNYRLLIGEGTTLHNLDVKGNAVKGWQLQRLPAPLAYTPEHYQSRGLDYLVFQCIDGSIYITDRTGTSRLKGLYPFKTTSKVRLVFPGESKLWYLTYIKPNGKLVSAFQNGKVDSVGLLNAVEYGMVEYDGIYLGYAGGNRVMVKDGDVIFDKKMPFMLSSAPKKMVVEKEPFYLLTSERDEKIAIIRKDGNLLSGFPVYGIGDPLVLNSGRSDQILLVCRTAQGHLMAYAFDKKLLSSR
ncbi:hypothetical protein JCM31826_13950 [Thermaurantimonas aggregans]|uniref:Uncharacterized protein n=1 Tax=Thermaurantimonas aggregans TaxID=2173829 RepID=A0A401XLN1_9FLAO|nr:DUF3352 domain-containing protein [Thermaurantimonas aggregans]MCX8149113.1 DUF3352 domain-containing protein [Thermaurantimonas aggregans]GCD77913.1 hypothetical protein JCM31826_13950 [Thermaurantimonas aggregans]